ncbi:MAG: MFS transporter [Streptosporangiaceae bacterium]
MDATATATATGQAGQAGAGTMTWPAGDAGTGTVTVTVTVTGQAAAGPAIAPLPLRRNLRFQTLWIGMTASTVGVSVADVAYPLIILAMTGSPGLAGLFAAVQAIGMLVAGLPAGSLADRYDSRTIVIATEAARAAVTAGVVVALVAGWLSLPLLLAAAALLGIGQAIKGAAGLLLMRSVVAPEQLTRALTQDEVRMNGAALAGPAIGGALYGVHALAHALPFMFTAGSFLVALAAAALMAVVPGRPWDVRVQPADRPEGATGSGSMLVGLRTLWEQPVLRAATMLIMFVNTIGAGLDLVIIVILRHQAVPPGMIGVALGAGAAGGLAGAPLVRVLHRLRPGVLMLGLCLLDVLILALLAVPFGPWWVAGLLFIVMLGVPAIRVMVDILVIRQAPPEQRGRVIAALMTLIGLGIPAGLAGCGLLLQYLPAQAAMLTLAAIEAAGVAYCSTKRQLRQARWPADPAM